LTEVILTEVTLTLPKRLAAFVSNGGLPALSGPASIPLQGTTWAEIAGQIADRFPDLARRVFCQPCRLSAGFALVVNDELMPPGDHMSLAFRAGDQLYIIEVFAGG
jgi:hypothetical protein